MIQSQALAILKTGANVFLTGEPGSGKTHLVSEYISYLRSCRIESAITASTGIAATHIGGMTIHSWTGIGIRTKLEKRDLNLITSNHYVVDRVKNAKVLIIDEVSMLLPETLVMVNSVCREIKQNSEAFGGLQVIFVGDFFQLPPVVKIVNKNQEQELFDEEQKSLFAYESPSWFEANPIVCYLSEQYRQDDKKFLDLLTAIRRDNFQEDHLGHINSRKVKVDDVPENVPKLYSRNISVDQTNDKILSMLKGKEHIFTMTAQGVEGLVNMLKKGCLSPENLILKTGASVMFTKNNTKEGFVNGTLGIVEGFGKDNGYPQVKLKHGKIIEVKPMDWTIDENERVLAKITQIPLRLAWAITVHKSQGMSLDEAVMDLSDVFEFGQGYVALSRVRRLSGLYIIGWNKRAFEVHPQVLLKDDEFREKSKNSEELLSKMPKEEIQKTCDNFIIISGGSKYEQRQETKINKNKSEDYFTQIRKKYKNAYKPWNKLDDKQLKELYLVGETESKLANLLGRKKGAIRSRLIKFGLLNETQF